MALADEARELRLALLQFHTTHQRGIRWRLSPLTADKTQKGSLSRVAPAAALGWARSRQRAVPQFYLVFQMRWMKALSHRSGGGRAAMAILIQPRVIELNHHDQYSAGSVRTPS